VELYLYSPSSVLRGMYGEKLFYRVGQPASRNRVVSVVISLMAGRWMDLLSILRRSKTYFFLHASKHFLWPNHVIRCVPEEVNPGVEWSEHVADHRLPSGAEVKM
jgi:hypothetical protein